MSRSVTQLMEANLTNRALFLINHLTSNTPPLFVSKDTNLTINPQKLSHAVTFSQTTGLMIPQMDYRPKIIHTSGEREGQTTGWMLTLRTIPNTEKNSWKHYGLFHLTQLRLNPRVCSATKPESMPTRVGTVAKPNGLAPLSSCQQSTNKNMVSK